MGDDKEKERGRIARMIKRKMRGKVDVMLCLGEGIQRNTNISRHNRHKEESKEEEEVRERERGKKVRTS